MQLAGFEYGHVQKSASTICAITPHSAAAVSFGSFGLLESRGDIIPRPSLLNLGVQLSSHPASDILKV
ncbi:hypothetical protein H6F50_08985 [Coleofasciculus sp. FACHB-712]|uniref:hypothetical protein n=1 Tax=Coleofasciculus sp. FACHB-712 TaxID=2692789 RepID=UPI0016859A7A|nr:hypothetical protein [Coleofasciculus sp. FACHB-712]MBD1942487.1 hypothetical protein [Coleofasciculus sp. FACHB-712]